MFFANFGVATVTAYVYYIHNSQCTTRTKKKHQIGVPVICLCAVICGCKLRVQEFLISKPGGIVMVEWMIVCKYGHRGGKQKAVLI